MQSRDYFDYIADQWDTLVDNDSVTRLNKMVTCLPIKEESIILDIGSGTGVLFPLLLRIIRDKGKLVALDSSRNMLLQAKAKKWENIINFIQADVHALPLIEHQFDFAICYSSFPHFSNKLAALNEMARVLKIGGTLAIIHTASMREINALHQKIGGPVRNHIIPEGKEVHAMLHHAGFDKIDIHDNPDSYLVTAYKMAD